MANGLAGNKLIDTENEAYEKFKKALYIVMECMTMMLASDWMDHSASLCHTSEGACHSVYVKLDSNLLVNCVCGHDSICRLVVAVC